MNERIQQLLAEIQRIQKDRQANWPNPYGPIHEDIEITHLQRIKEAREEISRIKQL